MVEVTTDNKEFATNVQNCAMRQQQNIMHSVRAHLLSQSVGISIKQAERWDHAFGVYIFVFGGLNGVAESAMVDLLSRIRPSLNDWNEARKIAARASMPSNCKMSPRKWRNRKAAYIIQQGWNTVFSDGQEHQLIRPYPWYKNETARAIEGLDPYYFEKWAKNECVEKHNLIYNLVDVASQSLNWDVQLLRYAIKNEMDKERMEDTDMKSWLYTCYILYDTIKEMHYKSMNVGPVTPMDKDECERLKGIVINHPGDSPFYDKLWEKRMEPALPTKNIIYIGVIKQAILGDWKHGSQQVKDGIIAIIRKSGNEKRIKEFDMTPVFEDSGFEHELELVNRISAYQRGDAQVTIHLLRAVKLVLNGMTLKDLENELIKDRKIWLDKGQRLRIIATAEMCRQIENGTLDIEELNRQMDEQQDEAARDESPLPDVGGETIGKFVDMLADGCDEARRKRKAEKAMEEVNKEMVKRKEINDALQAKNVAPDADDPLDDVYSLLTAKFGKVTHLKEKKPKPTSGYIRKKDVMSKAVSGCSEAPNTTMPEDANEIVGATVGATVGEIVGHSDDLELTIDPGKPRHHSRRWTEEENDYLRNHWQGHSSIPELMKHIGRTYKAIEAYALRMGLKSHNHRGCRPPENLPTLL